MFINIKKMILKTIITKKNILNNSYLDFLFSYYTLFKKLFYNVNYILIET